MENLSGKQIDESKKDKKEFVPVREWRSFGCDDDWELTPIERLSLIVANNRAMTKSFGRGRPWYQLAEDQLNTLIMIERRKLRINKKKQIANRD